MRRPVSTLDPQSAPAPSTSLDLPPALEALIQQEVAMPAAPSLPGLSSAATGMGSYGTQPLLAPSFQEGGMVGPGGMPVRPPQNPLPFGVERRAKLYPGEEQFFRMNPNVAGMATEDNKVILNPFSSNSPEEQNAVALNEAARVYMRTNKLTPSFTVTPEQRQRFVGTPYESNDAAMRETLAARILSGDPSAGNVTPEQRMFVDKNLRARMYRPSFQEGGMVGPGGMPIRPNQGGAPGLAPPGMGQPSMSPQQVMVEAQKFVSQNPQQFQDIQEVIQESIRMGEITLEEMNFLVQFAVAATQNPEMYPQLRASLISQGVADEDDLPPEYDPGFMFVLIVMGQGLQGMAQQAPTLEQAMGPPTAPQGVPGLMPSMARGGPLPERSSNPDGSIPINAHEGEYVIPAEVVRRKGTDFFDKMITQARGEDAKPSTDRS